MDTDNEVYEVQIHKTHTPRVRGPTWTDEEVNKLFLAWSQPKIFNGFLNEKKKKDVFVQLSKELGKYNVSRSWEECRAKIKNLKGDYKKAREGDNFQGFKYFALMDKIMTTSQSTDSFTIATTTTHPAHHGNQPVQIEFEILPSNELDFRHMKDDDTTLPIQISESGNIIIPHGEYTTVDTSQLGADTNIHIDSDHHVHRLTHHTVVQQQTNDSLQDADGTPLIVMTGEDQNEVNHELILEETIDDCSPSSSKRYPYRESYTNAGKKSRKSSNELSHKRRKLHTISEKMAETVDRILTQTTNSLIEEIKASEERYMMAEEKRRLEDQRREEQMMRNLIAAISHNENGNKNPTLIEDDEQEKESRQRQTMLEMIQSAEDPCAMTFDLLATRLTNTLTEQHKETEQMLHQWETKMQNKEMKHTENLFKMILSSMRNHNTSFS